MTHDRKWFPFALALASVIGCSSSTSEEPVTRASFELNACEETVPNNRFVDGLPAFSQCSDVSNGTIWSNNGVDTSLTSGGTDWVMTQRGGGYQCTEWAYRYMHFRWNVKYRSGNAKEWCDGMLPAGLVKSTTPVHGDLIVFDGGSCGSDETTGHVAVVDLVNSAAGTVTIVEQNRAGRRSAQQSCALCFLHAVANDGSNSGGAASGGATNGGATNGGATNGGAANGGAASGGATNGGATNGGATNGGAGGSSGSPGSVHAGAGGAASAGSPGVAGAFGSGGRIAMGGANASGGMTSTLPVAGSGHTFAGSAGAPAVSGGVAGAPANLERETSADGCSVATSRAAHSRAGNGLTALLVALLGVVLVRRRAQRTS